MRIFRFALVASALVAGACTGDSPVFEDRSSEVKIKHRVPSK